MVAPSGQDETDPMGVGHRRGRRGEELAASYLESHGWTVLDRNWRSGRAELDLVVRRDDVVAFVEVKTRAGGGCGDPLEAITWAKRRDIARLAGAWLATRGRELPEAPATVRFDAVAVEIGPGGRALVRHVPDAWRIGDA
jgi:putative endonuclease